MTHLHNCNQHNRPVTNQNTFGTQPNTNTAGTTANFGTSLLGGLTGLFGPGLNLGATPAALALVEPASSVAVLAV